MLIRNQLDVICNELITFITKNFQQNFYLMAFFIPCFFTFVFALHSNNVQTRQLPLEEYSSHHYHYQLSKEVYLNPCESEIIYGDIALGEKELALLKSVENQHRRRKRAAVIHSNNLWDRGVIPYLIEPIFDGKDRRIILNAMQHWELNTCLKFVPKEPHHKDYVVFTKESCGCCSYVGKQGSGQAISIGKNCNNFIVILHELGHAIGFYHEHNRPDRDNYIKILNNNLKDGYQEKVRKKLENEINSLGYKYDYKSIMHYPSKMLSKDSTLNTIQHINGSTEIILNTELSKTDIAQTKELYKCPKCGMTLRSSYSFFKSPRMLLKEDLFCEWRIKVSQGEVIVFVLNSIDIYQSELCEIDYFEIRDGYWSNSTLLGRHCGQKRNVIYLSTGNYLLITYNVSSKQEGYTSVGFTASYSSLCGKRFQASDLYTKQQYLESPDFPANYPPNKECYWIIEVPNNQSISLQFQLFDEPVRGFLPIETETMIAMGCAASGSLKRYAVQIATHTARWLPRLLWLDASEDCSADYLEVRNGFEPGNLLGRFCGSDIPEYLSSSHNMMTVKFKSDGSTKSNGFSAKIILEWNECEFGNHGCDHICVNTIGSYNCECYFGYELHSDGRHCIAICGGIFNLSKEQEIYSPSSPYLYPENSFCVWEFRSKNPLWLNFTHFDLEENSMSCEYDSVTVRSKLNGGNYRDYGKFCGEKLPPAITSEHENLIIEFKSDDSIQRSGFSAKVIPII